MSGEIVGLLSELECEDFVHFEANSMKSVELKDDDECWIMDDGGELAVDVV